MLSVQEDRLSVHEHVPDPGGQLVRLRKRGVVLDRSGIEDDDIGEEPRPQPPAPVQPEVVGGERGELSDRVLERENPLVTDVAPEQPRERPVGARVGIREHEHAFGRQ